MKRISIFLCACTLAIIVQVGDTSGLDATRSGMTAPIAHVLSDVRQTSCESCDSDSALTCQGGPLRFFGGSCAECDGAGECGAPCSPGCDACDACLHKGAQGRGLLGWGIVKPSDCAFNDFISPMTNPVYFEDPRQLSELRFIYLDHKIPFIGAPLGRIQLFAMQARVRLTERLSFIAVKDGFINSQSPIVADGWVDVAGGFKYTWFSDPCRGRLLSGGFRYESNWGSTQSLQGNGDGVFDIFLSGGSRIGAAGHLLTSAGFIFPVDRNDENQMFYWSGHLDRRITDRAYVFSEVNWYNYMRDGTAFPPIEGGDLFNFGSTGVRGNNILTNAYGLKFKPRNNIESGIAFEFPLTNTRGILDNRLTADLIIRY